MGVTGKNVQEPPGSAEEPDKVVEATCGSHSVRRTKLRNTSVAPVTFPGSQQGQVRFSTMESLLSSRDQAGARGQADSLSVYVLFTDTCKAFP